MFHLKHNFQHMPNQKTVQFHQELQVMASVKENYSMQGIKKYSIKELVPSETTKFLP